MASFGLFREEINEGELSAESGADVYADIYDGIQFVILADLFLYVPDFLRNHVGQLHSVFPLTTFSLIDGLGREAENGYNMWATAHMLQKSG